MRRATDERVLVIDAGNSRTKIALFGGSGRILKLVKRPTADFVSARSAANLIKSEFGRFRYESAFLGSVVPGIDPFFLRACERLGKRVFRIGPDARFNFRIAPKIRREQVGHDLFALAAYCSSRSDCAVGFSFGTGLAGIALADNTLVGAAIVAGLGENVRALFAKTGLIKPIQVSPNGRRGIGRDTKGALEAGLFCLKNGFADQFARAAASESGLPIERFERVLTGHEIKRLDSGSGFHLSKNAILIGYFLIFRLNRGRA